VALTYFHTRDDQASGVHVAGREKSATATAPASGTNATPTIAGGASSLGMLFTTVSGAPNIADWGSGTYRADLVVSAVGADMSYGLRTVGTAAGHFARVDSGLTTDIETAVQAEAAFTGTGLKSATVAWDPAAGNASDRFEIVIACHNAGSMNQTLTLDAGSAGSTMGGDFDAGGAAPAVTPQRTTTGCGV
jgi:hypothetical protein